jgi:hypothetical protein
MRSKKVKNIHSHQQIYRNKLKYYLPVAFLVILICSVLLARQDLSFKIEDGKMARK